MKKMKAYEKELTHWMAYCTFEAVAEAHQLDFKDISELLAL